MSGRFSQNRRAVLRALLVSLLPASSSLLAQDVVISELMASNGGSFVDEDGSSSDWFEVHNRSAFSVPLGGWFATDDSRDLRKWQFPAVSLPAGGYLLVFASGKDRAVPGSPLHTSFRLGDGGEYLALVRPDGATISHAYSPGYPTQRPDISYGLAAETSRLIARGHAGQYLVPRDGTLGLDWTLPDFAPGPGWAAGSTGIGFHAEAGGGLPPETVSFWSLDGALDDAGRGNHLSYEGGASPAYVPGFDGRPGGAVSLGGSDYLHATPASGLPIYSHPEFTVAMWVNGLPQPDRRVFAEGSSAGNNPLFTIGTDNGGTTGAVDIFIRTGDGTVVVNHLKSSRVAFDGSWHHIAWTDRSGDAALYVDGVRDARDFTYAKPTLSLDRTALGAVLRAAPCCLFRGSIDQVVLLDVALTAEEVAAVASGIGWGEGSPYEDLIGTDLGAAMRNVAAGAYLRLPFTAGDTSALDSLALAMKYDDGFVAYLNGFEVARRNAPPSPAWSSTATAERAVRDALVFEQINVAPSLEALRAGLNVLAVHGLNRDAADGEFLVLPELIASSTSSLAGRYFRTPTPGAANEGGVVDFVEDTVFSVDRGFHTEPFTVEITTPTPGATIRYTLDGSAPSASRGLIYGGPIRIGRTTTLRAAAFLQGFEPTNVDTHTYIFLEDVIRQPAAIAGYPTSWQGWPADYAMDPAICTDTGSPHYAATIRDDLKSLPTLSIALEVDDWMGPTRGIYTHSLSRGVAWERPASVELIDPAGREEGFQIDCGIRVHGGSSARPGEGKHALRLVFKSIYGAGELEYPLYPDSRVESFDTLVLRCFSTDSWHFKDGGARYRRWDSQFIRDLWMRDSQRAMGQPSSHSRYVHLYLNGLYWGIYDIAERPDDSFQASHRGGREEDWDVVKDFNELFRGTRDAWSQLMSLATAGLGTTAAYQRVQGNNPDGTRNPAYPVLLDEHNLVDYMILHLFGCAEDWPHHNWYAARDRTGERGGWQFFVWDQEIVLDFVFRDRVGVSNDNSPARVYSSLRANPEFRLHFADRVQKHLFNGGALSVEECRKRWLARADTIDRAVAAESARWGDYRMDVPDPSNSPAELYTREGHWLVEKRKVLDIYLPESHRLAMERFRANNLYPPVAAPRFGQHGGLIAAPYTLQIADTAGTTYYTVDGSDPRLPGGAVAPEATAATGAAAIVLTGPTVVKTRARDGEWSALTEAFFYLDIPLRITEIMYHPAPLEGGSFDTEEYEFLELVNLGSEPLDLTGCLLSGAVELEFPAGTLLGPGSAALLVEDLEAFDERYPGVLAQVVLEYSGRLDNAGERILLAGPRGEPILDFAYSDIWHPATDGEGRSLVVVDPAGARESWALASSWRASAAVHGSPGVIEGWTPPGGLRLPGDANGDGSLDLSDAVRQLFILFAGVELPCGGASPLEGGNAALLDVSGDAVVDIADTIHLLAYLFRSGPAPARGIFCIRVDGCAGACGAGGP